MNKFIRIKNRYFDFLKAAIQGKYFEFAYYGLGRTSNKNKLSALKNCYMGRRAFIIGNGPSLRNTDIQKLKGEITIGSNSIFLLFEDTGFRPTFYTVEDRLVAEDRAPTINKLTGEWAARMGINKPILSPALMTVEWWTHTALADYLTAAVEVNPGMLVNKKPRNENGPLIAFKSNGQYGLLDGRHRATQWQHNSGVYPLLVLQC